MPIPMLRQISQEVAGEHRKRGTTLRSAATQEHEKSSEEGDPVTREISESTQGGVERKVEDGMYWREEASKV